MRKLLITAATLLAGAAVATPAAAQYYPAPPPPQAYGNPYGAPYGNAYGYHNNFGQVRALQARVDQLQRLINRLDRRDAIRNREADRLRKASRDIERRLRSYGRNGLNQRESYVIHTRIARLEQRIQLVLRDGNRWGSRDQRWGQFWTDYDRDGRNDRWEDDRGRRHDRH